jgi:retron-type reverse transcriptase
LGSGWQRARSTLFTTDRSVEMWKGPRKWTQNVRSHSTSSGGNKLERVSAPEVITYDHRKDFRTYAKHWYTCHHNPQRVFQDLHGLLKLDGLWFAAYLKLSRQIDSTTMGPDGININQVTMHQIMELKRILLNGSYEWTGVRRVLIDQPGKYRPLGIPGINDRIVQEVLRLILEPIFEAQFLDTSHGFRTGRSTETALRALVTHHKAANFFVEGDIKKVFINVDHNILMHLIEKRVKDKEVLKLLRNGLKAKVFQKDQPTYTPVVGTPQGGILSPLLSNVYLHELDLFMEKLAHKYEDPITPANRRKNPEYIKLMRKGLKFEVYRRKYPSCLSFFFYRKKRIEALVPKVRESSALSNQGLVYNALHYKPYPSPSLREGEGREYKNLRYLRYADNFVIGVTGSRKFIFEIRDEVKEFLNTVLKLELSPKVTHISKGIPFLGHVFCRKSIFTRQQGKYVNRHITIPTLDIDLKKLTQKLAVAGFCDRGGKPKPPFRLLRLPQSDINNYANQVIIGLAKGWRLAGNRKQASYYLSYILRYSLAKLYAAKFKYPTIASVFKVAGNDLGKPIGTKRKSAVGVTDKQIEGWNKNSKTQRKIVGILYDRFHKTPKPFLFFPKVRESSAHSFFSQG